MSQLSSTLRTKETNLLLQTVDASLGQCKKLNFTNALGSVDIESVVRTVDRARLQFEAKLFFVVIFGPLKAGKSTLTNALAGEYVSPSGFGKETTRRPSLIIADAVSGIDQYFSTDPEVNSYLSQRRAHLDKAEVLGDEKQVLIKVREDFDTVADYLRKIRSKDEIQKRIRVVTLQLNDQNLERSLSEDLTTEPLLTVIRCKGGQLLGHGVAIVDMPGLDGSKSNWRDDPIHEWVINRAEFFLFVQSSVAALNIQTHDFLKEIVSQSTKPPIWFVQNIFDAQHWQPMEKRERAAMNQREEGKKRVIELLNVSPRAVMGLNVGLAWDAKSECRDDWLQESKFTQFESGLTEELHAERAWIQERNCLEYLNQVISKAKPMLNQISQEIDKLRNDNKIVRETLIRAQGFLDKINYRNEYESMFRGEIATIAEDAARPWLESLETSISKLKEQFNREKAGKYVNEQVRLMELNIGSEGDSKYFIRPLLLPRFIELSNKYGKLVEVDAIANCNQLLDSLKLSHLPTPLQPTVENLPTVSNGKFTTEEIKLRESPKLNPFWTSDYNGATNIGHMEEVAKSLRQQIHDRKVLWKNEVVEDYFTVYCEKRRSHFQTHLQKHLANFDNQAIQKEEAASITDELVMKITGAFGQIQLPLANAITSMKYSGPRI